MSEPREARRLPGGAQPSASLARRLMWFVLLWAGGVATVAAVAYAIRFLIAA
ncbi:MAG: DUF2474 domain-containing protein [Hyphomicrobiaceae bacterium]|nr:DUF2474 domain-containing protein [Hyphomicrobiaceae bacterium]